jgi:hypothetical protein
MARPRIHPDLRGSYVCHNPKCGKTFTVVDPNRRAGREPKYCSPRCYNTAPRTWMQGENHWTRRTGHHATPWNTTGVKRPDFDKINAAFKATGVQFDDDPRAASAPDSVGKPLGPTFGSHNIETEASS